jgi:hypothetical protein
LKPAHARPDDLDDGHGPTRRSAALESDGLRAANPVVAAAGGGCACGSAS